MKFTHHDGREILSEDVQKALNAVAEYEGKPPVDVAALDSGLLCGARSVFWEDAEHLDVECILPFRHERSNIHAAEVLGVWNADDLNTWVPEVGE